MQANKIAQYVTKSGSGYELYIPVQTKFAGVNVTAVTMYIEAECDDGYYGDGDLAVKWDASGLENTGGGDMGTLIMRGDNDEVGAVMGEFYWEHGFDSELREILQQAGFSAEAAADVCGSEWGMQDEERASYDANAIAYEVRAAMQTVVA